MTDPSPERTLRDAVVSAGLAPGSRLLVAVSGGLDSVTLLDTVCNLSSESDFGWKIRVGHINHGLRGPESDSDEALVRALCRRYDLALDVTLVDTQAWAARQRLSIEQAARELRYNALREILRAWNGDHILLGHHQEDQAETLL